MEIIMNDGFNEMCFNEIICINGGGAWSDFGKALGGTLLITAGGCTVILATGMLATGAGVVPSIGGIAAGVKAIDKGKDIITSIIK